MRRVFLLLLAGRTFVLVFQVGVGPAIDAAVALVGNLGFVAGLALQLDLPSLGNVDLQLLVENDALVGKVGAGPKLARGQRIGNGAQELVFQHVSRAQGWNADVLLVIVGVHRSIGQGEVLNRRLLRGNDGSVWFVDPYIDNLQLVAERAVADFKLAHRLHAALADDPDLRVELVPPGPVIFETERLMIMLHDNRFLRIIRKRGRRHCPVLRRRDRRGPRWRLLPRRQLYRNDRRLRRGHSLRWSTRRRLLRPCEDGREQE